MEIALCGLLGVCTVVIAYIGHCAGDLIQSYSKFFKERARKMMLDTDAQHNIGK